MATLRKRGTKWQVQIRRNQAPNLSKTFVFKEDALRWARENEGRIDRGEVIQNNLGGQNPKFCDILIRYKAEVTSKKRSFISEESRIRTILQSEISSTLVINISTSAIATYRETRLKNVSGASVRKEISLILHVLKIAQTEWGVSIRPDSLIGVSKPLGSKPRTRRLESNELKLILDSLKKCRNPLIAGVFSFALATGMRRGEILALTWLNVDPAARTVFLPLTKNGDSRTVPLNHDALEILKDTRSLTGNDYRGYVFPISANALRLAWERVRARTSIRDLRFHDLRHEAISRFFELGLSVPEVALISGHKDPRMLFRYTHLRATDLAEKLAQLSPSASSNSSNNKS